jgi:hypothetical protein
VQSHTANELDQLCVHQAVKQEHRRFLRQVVSYDRNVLEVLFRSNDTQPRLFAVHPRVREGDQKKEKGENE